MCNKVLLRETKNNNNDKKKFGRSEFRNASVLLKVVYIAVSKVIAKLAFS